MRIALALLLAVPVVAHAGVYKCVDAAGKTTYSDKPCQGNESRAGMDVKGMTYSSDEVMYSNERAANIIQGERATQEVEEQSVEQPGPNPAANDSREKKAARKQAKKAEGEERQRKAASAGIQNGGTPWIPAAGGAIDPKTGEFKVDAAGGYVDPKTGKFIPATGK